MLDKGTTSVELQPGFSLRTRVVLSPSVLTTPLRKLTRIGGEKSSTSRWITSYCRCRMLAVGVLVAVKMVLMRLPLLAILLGKAVVAAAGSSEQNGTIDCIHEGDAGALMLAHLQLRLRNFFA